jgi:phosphoglycolate phosphatase-like HAD superfamily hydrolase
MHVDLLRAAPRALGASASRRAVLRGAGALALGSLFTRATASVAAQDDPLPSWNDGKAKQAILDFVAAATKEGDGGFVPPEQRIATFDQDGTLWVEHPIYTQAVFAIDRIKALAPEHPEWKTNEPYASILAGNQDAIARFSEKDWEQIVGETHSGVTVEAFNQIAADWMATAKDPHFDHRYAELTYQPMLEVLAYLRANEFRTYIVSGSGQMFMRSFAEHVFGVPPEQVIGTGYQTTYEMGNDGAPVITVDDVMLVNDNFGGKPEDISLFIGKRPAAAFGNSTGDQQMLEWTGAGDRATLMMLVHHTDAEREYAYGPAGGLPDTGIGVFTDALLQEAIDKGWFVIDMKNDWKTIFG